MIINDLDDYYIVFDTKNRNTELDTLLFKPNHFNISEILYKQMLCFITIWYQNVNEEPSVFR